MNELRGSRESQALARRYNSPDDPLQTIASDLFPTVELSDTRCDPELHFLKGSKLLGGVVAASAGGAGFEQHCIIVNPASSGIIAVVELIQCSLPLPSAADPRYTVFVLPDVLTQDSSDRGFTLDQRFQVGSPADNMRSSCLIGPRVINAATVGNNVGSGTSGVPWIKPIVLPPGSSAGVRSGAANVTIQAAFVWRERRIELGEQLTGA